MDNYVNIRTWNNYTEFSNIFENNPFEQILVEVRSINNVGETIKTYTNVGVTDTELYNYWKLKYKTRLVAFDYDGTEDIDIATINEIKGDITTLNSINTYKYRKLIETLTYTYDPISNYDMTETGTDKKTGTDTTGTDGTHTNTVTGTVADTNSSTTYDNTATWNPATKSETTTNNTNTTGIDDTMTTTYNNSLNHTLSRSGNIGVTTSQQMIESQRQLVMFKIIDEYLKDVNQLILLNIFDD